MALLGPEICLVFSCRRPYYIKRLEDRMAQYKMIATYGFKVLFLYGDSEIQTPELRTEEWGECLYVPVEDKYSNLTHKMLHAYQFLLEKGVSGVLKIDDDTIINNYNIFKTNFRWYDYSGADVGEQWPETVNLKDMSFTTTELICYFGGPFYWLSFKGLGQVVRTGFKYPAEDLNVGYAINLNENMLIGNMMFKKKGDVSWSNETE